MFVNILNFFRLRFEVKQKSKVLKNMHVSVCAMTWKKASVQIVTDDEKG
jgi:hypothetical protein